MHICLLPLDILLDIFETIYDPIQRRDSLATIAALARTCKEFKEPALDSLWRDIYSFKPLILCLPEGVRGITPQGQLTLKRPLFSGEWKIFNSYACRIRSLFIYHRPLDEIDGQAMKVLVSAPSPTLLPNLHNLQWWNERDSCLPLLQALLVSTIRTLMLFRSPRAGYPSFAKSALLASLAARCPHIEEFVCPYSRDSNEHSDSVSESVCGWSKLFSIEAGVLSTRALTHLTSLPSLKFLAFMSCGFVNSTQFNSIPTFTSKLIKVSITAPSLPILILRNVYFASCQSLVLCLDDPNSVLSHPLDISDLIVSLSECFSSDLEKLAVEITCLGSLSTGNLADPHSMLNFDAVNPLLSFNCLQTVNLSCFCASAIDDATINMMAQSWPQLQQLYLGSGARWPTPPSLTFTGLVHLIRHCHQLHDIAIPFCASLIDNESEPFSKTIPNVNITHIYVVNCPIDAAIVAAVACQLHTLLPNLTNMRHHFPWDDAHPPQELEHAVEWGRVEEFLGVLVKCTKMKERQVHILQECSSSAIYDPRRDRQDSLATLAALARTCKKFKEPALNILWKDVHGFGPLVLCLPEGVREITEQGQLTLTRPLFSEEWKIFNSYACRIRSLLIDNAMNETVCYWSKLIHLKTGVLNTQALAHLASSPSLKSLDFMSSVYFITCRSIVLSVYDLDSLLSRLLDIPDLFVSFAECFSSTLEQFAVHFPGLGHLSIEKLAGPPFMLSFDAVAPLLSFSCLKKIDLGDFCTSAIDDAMIKTMAQSWPRLKEFSLGCRACWQIPPSLTFTGLVHLIRHCQDLREIAIRFRASVIIRDSEPFSKTIPNVKITDIYVGNPPIDAGIAAAVACQLHTLLPNLTSVDCFPWMVLHLPPDFEDFKVEWERVEEFLGVLVEGAKMRETQGQVLQECSLPD
ncbi:hypothetical protein AZE42_04693 [Rhizopogon vesiculosus]|uniref:F-box domain-containing protein n=1 Tax=Rhizopogon vesiculosus TaxID=180088 RepID=A0A1J8Q0Q2_9AGAM|nr:hypothetical protein AZE42_04693 [Rhizopogon vesiculosus]